MKDDFIDEPDSDLIDGCLDTFPVNSYRRTRRIIKERNNETPLELK